MRLVSSLEAALRKSEMQKSDLEMELSRMKAEEANLKDALLKLHSLNDALNHDKNELSIAVIKVIFCIFCLIVY
jgi:SMC interacting uncharacterized protein involved in chromosome segregation